MKNLTLVLALALAVVLTDQLTTLATRNAGDPLSARVEALERTVTQHKLAIKALQIRTKAIESGTKPIHTHRRDPKITGWNLIDYGLNKKRVQFLLGAPTKKSKRGETMVWQYPDRDGGKVEFEHDKVVRWTMPPKKQKHWP